MIAHKVADKQVSRLKGLDFAPNATTAVEAIVEVRNALASAVVTEDQAREVIDAWLAQHTEYPKPADIYTLGRDIRERTSNVPRGCERCHGTGYHSFVRRVQAYPGKFGSYWAECCEHCTCPLGVWRAQKQAEQRAEAR